MPSSSLVPENDASVLFTTAGMQQFKPYYIGKKSPKSDFGTLNTVSIQKCVRTSDIDEVGDERHLTFFEMLGNFSFGGYWKKEAIEYAYDFVVNEMNLKIDYVTVFDPSIDSGQEGMFADTESERIWKSIDLNIVVKKFGRTDNFWGPTGEEGPCGPTTEIYVDGIEIWNIVFNEFYQSIDKSLKPLEIKGIDTGMGLERLAKVIQKVPTVFETDLFDYLNSTETKQDRIIADHLRTAVFMIADGVAPSNTERGYVLRRLIRRVIINKGDMVNIVSAIIKKYKKVYDFGDSESILSVIKEEQTKFKNNLESGMPKVKKIFALLQAKHDERRKEIFESGKTMYALEDVTRYGELKAKDIFDLKTTDGIDYEIVKEYKEKYYKHLPEEPDLEKKYRELLAKHQETSRAGMEQKFKGGLGGHSDMEVKYHTVTHLLHQALRDVLGTHVEQRGSNITPERLRFDFSHPQKMTTEEIKKVEDIVNQKIKEVLPMNNIILPKEQAEKSGALHFFGEKYGEQVSIYYIGSSLDSAYSKEFCGGPHVKNTSELGSTSSPQVGPFKITKEEAISAGIRRIKAILK